MPCLVNARISIRLSYFVSSRSVVTPTHWLAPARRAFSGNSIARSPQTQTRDHDLFDVNDALRLAERRRVFNIDGLCRLAAQSVGRNPDDVVNIVKLAEGGFNRTLLITMRDGLQMVARIPYPVTTPKYFGLASEVATMVFLRSAGLPVPRVYGYAPESDNEAETDFIFMEFVTGINLGDVWFDLEEREIISVCRELAELEKKVMDITFPVGGSLYYARDLENVGKRGIPLEDRRFCVGPDTRLHLWFGRRSQLDVNRGPYESAEAALRSGAEKELAFLERFGRPLLPLQRLRRENYQYKEQSSLDHAEYLRQYLLMTSSLVPRNPALNRFCIRPPDLLPSNIIVSKSEDGRLRVVGLLDWQHTSILPMFIHAGIPNSLQNYDDPISDSLVRPTLPEDFDDMTKSKQEFEWEMYRRRLVHYHYLGNTQLCNPLLCEAILDPLNMIRRRLFYHSGEMWEGDSLPLKVDLIEATRNWDALTEGLGPEGAPCPVAFDAEDVEKTLELNKVQQEMDDGLKALHTIVGCGSETWVPPEDYEDAMATAQRLKKECLAMMDEGKERDGVAAHWPLDDMDEEDYS